VDHPAQFVTVVSGYPRSGTSLMMQMLAAGGMDVVVDDAHKTDEHNPRGYYEYGPALSLGSDVSTTDWVAGARGKAVKVMAYQLGHLPDEFEYRVVFMRRTIAEVLASWDKMGLTRKDCELSERERVLAFKTEYATYEAHLERRTNVSVVYVQYNDVIAEPAAQADRVAQFLGVGLDVAAAAAAVDPALYRNRGGGDAGAD
jgi:hypothetical protein